MRVPSSKFLMSPARSHQHHPSSSTSVAAAAAASVAAAAPSLSASLSRRLRSSGSVKGLQSPMFPSGGRRRNCTFEAAEPSSPKVTCIGQVRVKSKKKKLQQQQQLRAAAAAAGVARSRSVRSVGETASFREHSKHAGHGGYGWVHQIPVSICEALRAVGEFNCFLPCTWKSFCCYETPSDDEKQSKAASSIRHGDQKQVSSYCGAVFARWPMAFHENEVGKQRREVVGLVVEEGAEVGVFAASGKRDRNSADELQVVGFSHNEKKEIPFAAAVVAEEDEARASVCIPPRNALLLMRCRSDPVKMAALASRFWDSPAITGEVVKEHDPGEEDETNVDQFLFGSSKADEKELESTIPSTAAPPAANDHTETRQAEENAAIVKDSVENYEENVATVVSDNDEEEDQRRIDEGDDEEEIDHAVVVDKEEHFGVDSTDGDDQLVVDKHDKIEENPKALEIEARDNSVKVAEKEEEEAEEEKQEVEVINARPTAGRCSSTSPSMNRQKLDRSRSIGGLADKGKEAAMRRSFSTKEKERRRHSFSSEKETCRSSFSVEQAESRRASFSSDGAGWRRWSFSIDKEDISAAVHVAKPVADDKSKSKLESENNKTIIIKATETEKENEQVLVACSKQDIAKESGDKGSQLPDCLLLMMYEPKLSMEVSKETWVCSTDFLRWRPHHNHHQNKQIHPSNEKILEEIDRISSSNQKQCNENIEKVIPLSEDSTLSTIKQPRKRTLAPQPPSVPPLPPSGLAIKMKLQNAAAIAPLPPKPQPQQPPVGYGPFMLTRCKSEPMRSSARLAPIDVCFWKSRHQPIGAIGF